MYFRHNRYFRDWGCFLRGLLLAFLMWGFMLFHAEAQVGNGGGLDGKLSTSEAPSLDSRYGVDLNLVNGRKYVNMYGGAMGHPFLLSEDALNGSVTIRGKQYTHQVLNYDVYNQELLVEYTSGLVGKQRYVVPGIFLEGFSLEDRIFQKMKVGEEEERIYELLSGGRFQLLMTHDKMYDISKDVNFASYAFSGDIAKMYLVEGDMLVPVRNNRTFRQYFPEEMQGAIKDYMKRRHLKIRRAGIKQIKHLMWNIEQM